MPLKAGDHLSACLLIGPHYLAQILGSSRAESAVESTRSQNSTVSWRRSAADAARPAADGSPGAGTSSWASPGLAVGSGVGAGVGPVRSVPHVPQNLNRGRFSPPHCGQRFWSGEPHSPQNFIPSGLSEPQFGQRTCASPCRWLGQERLLAALRTNVSHHEDARLLDGVALAIRVRNLRPVDVLRTVDWAISQPLIEHPCSLIGDADSQPYLRKPSGSHESVELPDERGPDSRRTVTLDDLQSKNLRAHRQQLGDRRITRAWPVDET